MTREPGCVSLHSVRRARLRKAIRVSLALALPMVVGLASARLEADIILLRNGNQVQGEVVEQNRRFVTVQVPHGMLRIPRREVLRVHSESRLSYLIAEGEKAARRDEHSVAIEHFQSALEEDGESARARRGLLDSWQGRARQLAEQRLLTRARDAYEKLLELAPQRRDASLRLTEIRDELARVAAEEKAARKLLDSGESDAARERLEQLYEEYPERREDLKEPLGRALLAGAREAYGERDLERAEKLFTRSLSFHPDLLPQIAPYYAALKARQFQALGQEGEFEKLLEDSQQALDLLPGNPFLQYFHALALQGTGEARDAAKIYLRISGTRKPDDLAASVDALRRAAELKLTGRDPSDAERLEVEEVLPGDWRTLTTAHFVVYHRNPKVARAVAAAAESTYARLFRELGCQTHWHKRCKIYVHPTREAFQQSTGLHKWTGGSHRIVKKQGALSDHRIETFQAQPRLTQGVVPHEIAHAMLAHRLRYRSEPPLWLNEGLAIRIEPEVVKDYYDRVVSQALALGRPLSVTQLLEVDTYPEGDDVELFYALSHSLVDFLVEKRGLDTFLRFAEELTLSPSSLGVLLERHFRIGGPVALANLWRGHLAAR